MVRYVRNPQKCTHLTDGFIYMLFLMGDEVDDSRFDTMRPAKFSENLSAHQKL